MTLRDRIVAARARLIAAQIPTDQAARDAALLARHALGWDAATLLAREREPWPEGFDSAFTPLIDRRCRREPVAYIRGIQEFWGRDFTVSPAVLIPRPETELIVETALARLRAAAGDPGTSGAPSTLFLCDIGTGSGCLAVTLAAELPTARIVATDVSVAALDVARLNAERHGVTRQIEFRCGAYLAGSVGAFDAIVSNPPYVTEAEYQSLAPEVRAFEPIGALVAGRDGLDDIRALVRLAPDRLRAGGLLIFEMGQGQSHDIARLIAGESRLRLLATHEDLQGIPRVAVAARVADA